MSTTPTHRDQELAAKVRPMPRARYEVDVGWSYLERQLASFAADYGGCNIDPEYQRGHVWTADQQVAYVENVFRGVVPTQTLIWNHPHWGQQKTGDVPLEVQLVDGKQRLTAVRRFIANDLKIFGDETASSMKGTEFDLRQVQFRFRFAVFDFARRADLLQFYLDLNCGGTVHSSEELDRVRALREAAATPTRSRKHAP